MNDLNFSFAIRQAALDGQGLAADGMVFGFWKRNKIVANTTLLGDGQRLRQRLQSTARLAQQIMASVLSAPWPV